MKRTTVGLIAMVSLVATPFLSGCSSEPARQQVASVQPSGAPATAAQTDSRPSDIQSLQQDRKQDAQVISDAQKALGAVGH